MIFCFHIFYQDQQSESCSDDEGDKNLKTISDLLSKLNESLLVNDCQTTLEVFQQQQVRRDAECICDEPVMESLKRYAFDKIKSGESTSRNILNDLESRMKRKTFGDFCQCTCKKGM